MKGEKSSASRKRAWNGCGGGGRAEKMPGAGHALEACGGWRLQNESCVGRRSAESPERRRHSLHARGCVLGMGAALADGPGPGARVGRCVGGCRSDGSRERVLQPPLTALREPEWWPLFYGLTPGARSESCNGGSGRAGTRSESCNGGGARALCPEEWQQRVTRSFPALGSGHASVADTVPGTPGVLASISALGRCTGTPLVP